MDQSRQPDLTEKPITDAGSLSRRRLLRTAGGLGLTGTSLALAGACGWDARGAGRLPPPSPRRIGYVGSAFSPPALVFRQALRDRGWVEEENLFIEWGSGRHSQPEIPVGELLANGADLLVADEDVYIQAAKAATTTVPIVMVDSSDPVGLGFIASLRRPGGNITGLSGFAPQLNGKRLELLKEAMPSLCRVAVIWNPEAPGAAANFRATQAAAEALGVQVQSWDMSSAYDLILRHWYAFDTARGDRAEAILVLKDAITDINIWQIGMYTNPRSLPTMYPFRHGMENPSRGSYPSNDPRYPPLPPGFTQEGLMSYAVNEPELFRRAAWYVDKILRGAKPAELPVEQSATFDFILNLRAARWIGFTFPPSILAQATEVIR